MVYINYAENKLEKIHMQEYLMTEFYLSQKIDESSMFIVT